MQGLTTDNSSQFSVVLPKNNKVQYSVHAQKGENTIELRSITIKHYERDHSSWAVDKIYVSGLQTKKIYTLEVRDFYDNLIDVREFQTLNISKPTVKFVAASGLDQELLTDQKIAWANLVSHKPQIIFLLGNNVYIARKNHSHATPNDIWNAYVQSRLALDIFHYAQLTPILAIWNESDYGLLKGDKKYPHRSESSEIFQIFYAQDPQESTNNYLQSGPGTSHFFSAFQMNFALMDNRFFRSPLDQHEDQTYWGPAQERWLFQNLEESKLPTWILNGEKIFYDTDTHASYEDSHKNSFNKIIPGLGTTAQPLIYLSASQLSSKNHHVTSVIKINRPKQNIFTYQIATGPLHASSTMPNFLIVESKNINNNVDVNASAFSSKNKKLSDQHFFLSKRQTAIPLQAIPKQNKVHIRARIKKPKRTQNTKFKNKIKTPADSKSQ